MTTMEKWIYWSIYTGMKIVNDEAGKNNLTLLKFTTHVHTFMACLKYSLSK